MQAQRDVITETLSMDELAQRSGIAPADLYGLVDYGVLMPISSKDEAQWFSAKCVVTLKRAEHLRQDLALDNHAFALSVMLISQIANLEETLSTTQHELSRCRGETSRRDPRG